MRSIGGPLTSHRLGRVHDGRGDDRDDVVLTGEAHLRVELHELELPVGAQVLVAEAPAIW